MMQEELPEDQIIRRAQAEVAARRSNDQTSHRPGLWSRVLALLPVVVLLAFFAAPGSLPHKLLLAMSGICGVRPRHSFFVGGVQLPLEARMTGIDGGLLLTLLVLLLARRTAARRSGSWPVVAILLLCLLSMVFDGVNSTLAELGRPHLYTSPNTGRLLTGLLASIALAPVLIWLLEVVTVRPGAVRRDAGMRAVDLVLPVLLSLFFGVLVRDGRAAFSYPIALVSVGGVVMALTGVALLVILATRRQAAGPLSARSAYSTAGAAVLLAFALLAGPAARRWASSGGV